MESKGLRVLKAHVALNVSDVGRSIEFYRSLFGIEPSKVRTGYAKFDVETPPLNLTLNERAGVARGALSHLGVQVGSTADVFALRERWRAAGLETFDETQTNCCYALQDKSWVTDPDGNSWEAFVVLEDNLPETNACCAHDAPAATEKTQASAEAQKHVESQTSVVSGTSVESKQHDASCCVTAALEGSTDEALFADCGLAGCCAATAVSITR